MIELDDKGQYTYLLSDLPLYHQCSMSRRSTSKVGKTWTMGVMLNDVRRPMNNGDSEIE